MKFEEEVQCISCGMTFIRTNPTNEYCEGKCRVAAHRKRQGNKKPIFDKEQARLVEQITQILLRDFEQLMNDAIRYRIFIKFGARYSPDFSSHDYTHFQEVYGKIQTEVSEIGDKYLYAINSVDFMSPLKKLLQYTEENSINFFKKGNQ